MKSKSIFILVYFLVTLFSFAQTNEQKEMIYKFINGESSPTSASIFSKPKPIARKEVLFSEATVFPVYKITFDTSNKPKLIQNKNYFFVLYLEKLYQFIDESSMSEYFKDDIFFKSISKLNIDKSDFKIVYFSEGFGLLGKNLFPLITDSKLSTIKDKDKTYSFNEYTDSKYGAIEKIKEIYELEVLREKLSISDYYNFMKSDYGLFNYYCPKDTTLVLNTLIKQIKLATKNLSAGQETRLLNQIKQKINPFESFKKVKNLNSKDTDLLQTKEREYNLGMLNVNGFYEYKIYNVSITNELLQVLTTEQFVNYKNFIDLWKPQVETLLSSYSNKYRYTYGIEIVKKEGIKYKHYMYFKDKILEDCGCPYDETVEGRKKRIILGG